MLREAILRKKTEPTVLPTTGSTEANSVCVSEGFLSKCASLYHAKTPQSHTTGKRPRDWASEDLDFSASSLALIDF